MSNVYRSGKDFLKDDLDTFIKKYDGNVFQALISMIEVIDNWGSLIRVDFTILREVCKEHYPEQLEKLDKYLLLI